MNIAQGLLPFYLVRVRSDCAAHVHELLNWCRKERPGRPRKLTDQGLVEGGKEWAEGEFVPTKPSDKRGMKPDRYLAICIRPLQGETTVISPESEPDSRQLPIFDYGLWC